MNQQVTIDNAIQFVWHEAELLDRQDYEQWLDLWTEDGLYIVPIELDAEDYAEVLNYAYDDAALRAQRIARLRSKHAMSALTSGTTIRTVSRFSLTGEHENDVQLRAAQHVVEYRRDRTHTIAANLDITVRRTESGLRLAKKVIKLANSGDAVSTMGYLL